MDGLAVAMVMYCHVLGVCLLQSPCWFFFFLLDVQLQKPREDESIKDTVLLTTSEFVSRRRSGSKRVVRVRF